MKHRKSQIPNPKSQGSFKSQTSKGTIAARIATLVLGIWCLFGIWSLGFGASAEMSADGYGPPTSLPPNYSVTAPAPRPRQNWIDQSQAAADAKSSGHRKSAARVCPQQINSHSGFC